MADRACMVIADISGYTSYLAGVELDHAQDVVADLVNTVVKSLRPPFKLAKLEGDAAFVYAFTKALDGTDVLDGSILLDTIEGCYFAFRRRLRAIGQASSCQCNACVLIPSLDLKIVAHHGEAGLQKMAGRSELMGPAVIVVHRLLKNSISIPAYAFITDSCVAATELDPVALGLQRHVETYEHVGEIGGWIEDLEAAFARYEEQTRVYVTDEQASLRFETFYPAPAEMVWEFISSPLLRPLWGHGMDRVDQQDPAGRRRVGTVNHCVHGDQVFIQEFLGWKPPYYYTAKTTLAPGVAVVSTHEVEPLADGAVLVERFQRPKDKKSRQVFDQMGDFLRQGHEFEAIKLGELLRARVAALADDSEPSLPPADEARRLATAVAN